MFTSYKKESSANNIFVLALDEAGFHPEGAESI